MFNTKRKFCDRIRTRCPGTHPPSGGLCHRRGCILSHRPCARTSRAKVRLSRGWTLYQARTQAQGYQCAAASCRVSNSCGGLSHCITLNILADPLTTVAVAGSAKLNDEFEVTIQKNGWEKIDDGKWISLSYLVDFQPSFKLLDCQAC